MEDDEEGPGHGAERENALGQVGDALLDDVVNDSGGVAFRVTGFGLVGYLAGDTEGICVERCLRDEAVGEGDPEETFWNV